MKNDTVSHEGIVQCINGTEITVQLTVSESCAACSAKHLCGTHEGTKKNITAHSLRNETFVVGEKVMVHLRETSALKAVVIGYLFPFFVLLISFLLMSYFCENELFSVIVSLGSVALYYFLLWIFQKKTASGFLFIVTKISE